MSPKKAFGILAGIFGLAVGLGVIGGIADSSGPLCKLDWTKCTDNKDMANNYRGWVAAVVDCRRETENRARYGTPDWPWPSFSFFQPGSNYNSGIATLIEPKAKFQNGFGAMAHSRVVCQYDLRTKKVVSVEIS